ncbi:deaminase [Mesorhizobium sp. M1148]|uniref:anti-phage dCTP deaminase n=1 Tax=unclassified Mesorhizobium TaxID=325217 RepID=UPI003334E156
MGATIKRIKFPEIFIGFVAPMGAEIGQSLSNFRIHFERRGYHVVEVKVTDVFSVFQKYVEPIKPLKKIPLYERYESHIAYGDQLRERFADNAFLASATVMRVIKRRLRVPARRGVDEFSKVVYLLHQFKRKEEIDLLRSVYGDLFYQVSVYSRRGARVDYLSRRFASDDNTSGPSRFRDKAEALTQADEHELGHAHGQRVSKIFHDADFIINTDAEQSVQKQIDRFCELLFGSNSISPTRVEYGMFLAKAAALRTLDLSRQVGAAVFSPTGEILALGSNEVPKATGGTYWHDEDHDDREYVREYDSNDQRKKGILSELVKLIDPSRSVNDVLENAKVLDSQFMDALEYGRIVHAEMSAITDAARLGHSVRDGTLYCTTFPCHMCAKHIVSAGIGKVIFLEPYPKSLASDLHSDSLQVESSDRGRYQSYPAVQFHHFHGVSPRRYRELFERTKRKKDVGKFEQYKDGEPAPVCDIKFPFYLQLEGYVADTMMSAFKSVTDNSALIEASET